MPSRRSLVLFAIVAALLAATILFLRRERAPAPAQRWIPGVADAEVFAAYAGAASCRGCHPSEYDAWAASHHGMAERLPDDGLDRAAFDPGRSFAHGTQSTAVREASGRYEATTAGRSGAPETVAVRRVIGHDPLRQFVVAAERGREQVLEAAYDPRAREWFNVYGDEDRKPGEWGHWTGRGMAWNTMCASCHNTRLRKHYVAAADSFHTTMAGMTVGCEACHGPMKAHGQWRAAHPDTGRVDPTITKFSPDQWLATCGACHARRSELTGDFVPGEEFTDHYALILPDYSDVYYADGQVRDENYEYAAFLGSRMHAKGVRCGDCHDPHAAMPKLEGDLVCMQCHSGARKDVPVIDPAAHGHHPPGPGSSCIGCHMPVTVYMQRHPRHDHGFTVPDPLLTVEHGTPNACNRCHADRDAEWALATVEKWYGAKMERPSRERARAVAAARRGDADARERVLALFANDSTAYWQAVAAGLMEAWTDDARVRDALVAATKHASPLVRAAAAGALEPAAADPASPARSAVWALCDDPDRGVRVAAAWALRATVDPASTAGRDLGRAIEANLDHPAGQMRAGSWHLARGETAAAIAAFERAVEWDPLSAPFRRELAVVLARAGRSDEALAQLEAAVKLAPEEGEYHYMLALALAERGDVDRAIPELETAVRVDPHHGRAWYNLGLARAGRDDLDGAIAALREAERADPRDPRAPYARATVHARRGETADARAAAQRALDLAPDYEDARRLLASLDR